jgi:two-component system sensor histidine kinase KdpD
VRLSRWSSSPAAGVAASIGVVAAVTAAIELFKTFVPVLSLGVLYVFAVLPIAVVWGLVYAVPVAVASMLAFNWFHLPPVHTFTLADETNWFALAVYLATAIVVSLLATRVRRRAAESEQREREAALLAEIASELLSGKPLGDELPLIADGVAGVLAVSSARIELGPERSPRGDDDPYPLMAGERRVGTLYLSDREEADLAVRKRFLPALASLLAVAAERERLGREASEAETLRQSDTIKTAIIHAVSHDLRTPLATIEAGLGGLQGDVDGLTDADRTELLDTMRVDVERLKRLIENLLDLSRLEAGAASPHPELWTADALVAQALEQTGAADRVEVSIPHDLPPVQVDASQVLRALVNLLENAVKFSPPDEPVNVRIASTRRELLIRVVDRGPGVPDEERERIFEPFRRVADGPTRSGAGLGLAIARGFAVANGGRVWVESHEGQGATFVLALPVAEVPAPVRA